MTGTFVNAYAALLELNYFGIGGLVVQGESRPVNFRLPLQDKPVTGSPFDFCYLVSPTNEKNVELNLSALPDMIGHRIYLDFDSSFADEAATLLNNGAFQRVQRLRDPFTDGVHSQNFFAFGLSSIQYPTEEVTEILGYLLGADLLSAWLQTRTVAGNVNERVQAMLPDLKLSDDFLLGNKDFFGKKDFESIDREIDAFVNGVKQRMPATNRVPFINEHQRQCVDHFRSAGMLKFYQDKRDDLDGAARAIEALLVQKVSGMLVDPDLGFDFVERALNEMARLLAERHQLYIDTLNGLPQKEAASRRALTGYFNELEQAERKIIPGLKDRAIKDALAKIGEALKMNLAATIGIRAYDFGRALLARTIDDIKALAERVVDWRHGIERLQEQLQKEIANRKAHLLQKNQQVRDFNGQTLFDGLRLGALYDRLDRASARRAIEAGLINYGILDLPFRGEAVVDAVYHAGLQWLTSQSRVRVSDHTVADKLLEEFPDPTVRRARLAENFAKSAPFLVFDGAQKQMYAGAPGVAYTYDPNTSVRMAAVLDDVDAQGPLVQVKKDLEAATGLPTSAIKKISDRDQILFLQEVTAFPLRVIKDVAALRDRYRRYVRKPGGLPLHIQASFDPPIPDLFLTSEQEKQRIHEVEEAWSSVVSMAGFVSSPTGGRESTSCAIGTTNSVLRRSCGWDRAGRMRSNSCSAMTMCRRQCARG